MADETQIGISQNTEITEDFALGHFLAAVCWGSFAGTGAMMAVLLISSGADFDLEGVGAALIFIGFFVTAITLFAMLFIGLPLTLILKVAERESAAIYASVGAIMGYLTLALMSGLPSQNSPEAFLLPLLGAFAGWSCALRWGRWREDHASRRQKRTSDRRTNPIHDLIH